MRRHLPDADLTAADLPGPGASWEEVADFGHRYHAYKMAGSLQRVAAVTLAAHDAWEADGTLPDTLPRLRLALFHTVRATHGAQPSAETETWARALVAAVADRLRRRDEDR